MLLLAHTGIALGLGWLIKEKSAARLAASSRKMTLSSVSGELMEVNTVSDSFGKSSSFTQIMAGIDLRVLVVGSMLPDIIDKPLGQIILRDSLNNGRIYSHTLLFLILLTLAGLWLYHSRRQLWIGLLAWGTLMHLLLDEVWLTPATLFWPLLGHGFPWLEGTVPEWIGNMFRELFSNQAVFIPELVGFIILVIFAIVLFRRHTLRLFLRNGLITK